MGQFDGRTALITGAASGIGAAVAIALDQAGIGRLILIDRDAEGLETLPLRGTIDRLVGDVGYPAFWTSNRARIGTIDFAVANAGIARGGPIIDLKFDEWRDVMAVNLDGAFLTIQAAMRAMTEYGGAIVATASASGIKPEIGTAAYGTSKAALLHLVRIAAKEGAATNIRVNAIAPAGVETPMWTSQAFFQELAETEGSTRAAFAALAADGTPLGRFARTDEVAGQILFLLSDAAATITGTTLTADGGYTL